MIAGAGRLEAQHGDGHRHVEALGPPAMLDAHPLVDRRVVGQAVGLAAGDDGDAAGPVDLGVRHALVRRRADQPQTGRTRVVQRRRRRRGRGTRDPADARTTLGLNGSTVPGVTHDGVDARRPRRSAGSCRGCRGRRSGRRRRPARRRRRTSSAGAGDARRRRSRPRGVSVSLIRSATPGAEAVDRSGAADRRRRPGRRTGPRPPSRRRPPRPISSGPSTTKAPSSWRELRRPSRRRSRWTCGLVNGSPLLTTSLRAPPWPPRPGGRRRPGR